MTEDIKKRTWFKYYRGIEDFILEAMRKSIENWEKCAFAHETGEESDAKGHTIEKPTSVSTTPAKTEKTKNPQGTKPTGCSHYVGYLLKDHPKKTPIPNECITCEKINQCLVRA
jgi:hypothetical protein